MPRHAEVKVLPYTPAQMFALVAAVEDYPQFLPWCLASRIKNRAEGEITADLIIGFKMFRETFTSRVLLSPPGEIKVIYEDGPLKHLINKWVFMDDPAGCRVDFEVDFAFRSRALEAAIGLVFGEAVRRMVNAFETRARRIYGEAGGEGEGADAGASAA